MDRQTLIDRNDDLIYYAIIKLNIIINIRHIFQKPVSPHEQYIAITNFITALGQYKHLLNWYLSIVFLIAYALS